MSKSKLLRGDYKLTFRGTKPVMPPGITPYEWYRISNFIRKQKTFCAWKLGRLLRRQLSAYQIYAIRRKLTEEGRLAGLIPNPNAPPVEIRVKRIIQPPLHRWQIGYSPKRKPRWHSNQLLELHRLQLPLATKVRRAPRKLKTPRPLHVPQVAAPASQSQSTPQSSPLDFSVLQMSETQEVVEVERIGPRPIPEDLARDSGSAGESVKDPGQI